MVLGLATLLTEVAPQVKVPSTPADEYAQLFRSNYDYDVVALLIRVFQESGQGTPLFTTARARVATFHPDLMSRFEEVMRR